jgi:hypothetical protein
MSTVKLLSAALIAATALATPAMAREGHVNSRHQAYATTAPDPGYYPDARYYSYYSGEARDCIPAPAVGQFASQPWTNTPPCAPGPVY